MTNGEGSNINQNRDRIQTADKPGTGAQAAGPGNRKTPPLDNRKDLARSIERQTLLSEPVQKSGPSHDLSYLGVPRVDPGGRLSRMLEETSGAFC